jgi:hypothetical protein
MRSFSLRGIAAIFALGLVAAACGGGGTDDDEGGEPQAAAPEEVTVSLGTEAIEAPESIESEPVTINVVNETDGQQALFFAQLNPGVVPDDFHPDLSGEEFFSLILPAGSTEEIDAGATGSVTMEFPEGSYAILGEGEGIPPAFFEVVPATGPPVEEPDADVEVEVGEFYFRLPETLPAGTVTVLLTNAGEQAHEFGGEIQQEHGASGGEHEGFHVLAPPPGGRIWIDMTFEPATYHVACFLPDAETGKPHIRLGMEAEVTAE